MDDSPTRISRDAYYSAISPIIDELDAQTDRGTAIVGVALLDDRLRQAVNALLDPTLSRADRSELFSGPSAPIGTYSARVRLARALGLFGDDLYADLKLLGRIRNKFAHHLDIREFRDQRIADLCAKLHGSQTVRVERGGAMIPIAEYNSPEDARRVFVATVQIALHFIFVMLRERGVAADEGDDLDLDV